VAASTSGAAQRVAAVASGLGSPLVDQLRFLVEVDQLKGVLRRSLIADGSRAENTAEHSWHLALSALVLAEHADEPVDLTRVVSMLLVHDLVEVDAGDTYVYDTAAQRTKAAREHAAAERIFGLLPPDQAVRLRAIWEEFEARESAEARFAYALDRLQPVLLNFANDGGPWAERGVRAAQVRDVMAPVADASGALADLVETIICHASAAGWLLGSAGDDA